MFGCKGLTTYLVITSIWLSLLRVFNTGHALADFISIINECIWSQLMLSFPGKQPASYRCLASVLITALCSLNKRCLAMENTAKGEEGNTKQNCGFTT